MRSTLVRTTASLALAAFAFGACGSGGSSGSSGSRSSTSSSGDAATVTVHAKDSLKFDKGSYEVAAGTVTLKYVNDGGINHTLLVEGVPDVKLAVGSEDSTTIRLGAGDYTLYCDITGHRAAGMVASLTVTP